jgi:hypothetical protein
MDTKQPTIFPVGREEVINSANESTAIEVIDDFESVQTTRNLESLGSADGVDAVGRPRLVQKPR